MEAEDPELGLAYYLYAVHGILPWDYYRRSQGEKDLIWAFASYEAEHKSGKRSKRFPPRTRYMK